MILTTILLLPIHIHHNQIHLLREWNISKNQQQQQQQQQQLQSLISNHASGSSDFLFRLQMSIQFLTGQNRRKKSVCKSVFLTT